MLALAEVLPFSPATIRSRALAALAPALWFLATFMGYAAIAQGHFVHHHYFVPLAQAFMQGRLDVGVQPDYLNELVPFGGKWYVVFPFMPALVILPWVMVFQDATNQAWPSIAVGSLNVALIYTLVRRMGMPIGRRMLFTAFFAWGTIHWYGAQDGGAWHFAQITALMFLILAVREVFGARRAWVMGAWLGCAMLCRLTDLLAFPFFLSFLLHHSRREAKPGGPPRRMFGWAAQYDWRAFGQHAEAFLGTLAVFVGLYMLYNKVRFGSPFTTGYSLIPGLLKEPWYHDGFFSLSSVPRNLYTLLVKAPAYCDEAPFIKPYNIGGLSILWTTPAFLWALRARGWHWLPVGAWLSAIAIATPILLHGDIGGSQFGYRYAMDFYPFLFLLMLEGLGRRMTFEQGLALFVGFALNAWGIWVVMTGNWA